MIDKKFYWLDTRTLAVILRPMMQTGRSSWGRFPRCKWLSRIRRSGIPSVGKYAPASRFPQLCRKKWNSTRSCNTWDWLRQTNSVSNRTIISIAGAFNYLSVLNLNSSWTFKDIYGYSGKFSPRFTRRRTDLDFIYCAQSRKQNIVQPYKFSKKLKKSEDTEKSLEYALKWLGDNHRNFLIQVSFRAK